ncbi:NAD(P)H-hydrate dehydratase [Chitinophaga sancti]|uniref:NAD(P)H-hydrate dehydratase n=1 Tax=Chitinophaga sancti TaxID=1004 RepID=UPI003F7A8758
MKIFTAQQIREADAYTIQHLPISSLDLMERAAGACTSWICKYFAPETPVYIYCGMGNNGGDGLAITRLLRNRDYNAHAFVLHHSEKATTDHVANREALLQKYPHALHDLPNTTSIPALPADVLIIDAILGTGLSRPVEGWLAGIIQQLQTLYATHTIISIDLPSGMQADSSSVNTPVVKAHHTLSFECYKLAFLFPENAGITGEVHILPIGLHPDYIQQTPTPFQISEESLIKSIYKPRSPFAHKGTYGHALLIAGSEGKMGAAILSAQSCLRAGVGLLTCHVPKCGYTIIQIAVPPAMCIVDDQYDHSSGFQTDVSQYKVIGIGPGIGTAAGTAWAMERLFERYRQPMVLDADALNILATTPGLIDKVPAGSLLTPHPKEFERLFGKTANNREQLQVLSHNAIEKRLCILLKGRYTAMAFPDGNIFFNTTGNPGMATGGSGDVLTGILTALLAQGYSSKDAMLMGVYMHGMAGDYAAETLSQEAMTANDIIDYLGKSFLRLHR